MKGQYCARRIASCACKHFIMYLKYQSCTAWKRRPPFTLHWLWAGSFRRQTWRAVSEDTQEQAYKIVERASEPVPRELHALWSVTRTRNVFTGRLHRPWPWSRALTSSAIVLLCAARMLDMQLSTTKRRVKEARNVRTVLTPALSLSSINARHDCKIHFTSAVRNNANDTVHSGGSGRDNLRKRQLLWGELPVADRR